LTRFFLATATKPLLAELAFLTVFLAFLTVFFTVFFAPPDWPGLAFFFVTFFATESYPYITGSGIKRVALGNK